MNMPNFPCIIGELIENFAIEHHSSHRVAYLGLGCTGYHGIYDTTANNK